MFQKFPFKLESIYKNEISIKFIQTFLDQIILVFAFVLAYLLRFDFSLTFAEARIAFFQLIIAVTMQFWILRWCQVHKFIWRYISLPEIKRILLAMFLATFPLLLLRLGFPENGTITSFPLSVVILDFFLAVSGILGIRLIRREIYENVRRAEIPKTSEKRKRCLLVGAGRAGMITSTEIMDRCDLNYDIQGFIDDDSIKIGSTINSLKVVGKTEDIPSIVKKLQIDTIIITMARVNRRNFRRIHNICKHLNIEVKTIPGIVELLQDEVLVSRIRDVELEDLLGRSPVSLDDGIIQDCLEHKRVLVTGAGGSIGSELTRQLLHYNPQEIILVERSEFALFNIEQEISLQHPLVKITPLIADICDKNRMTGIFENYRPQVVFHAAAHKHVPIMEQNPAESLKNNVLGTNLIGSLAGENNVEKFVLISTDKAVNPTSVMGATKRIAELIIQDLNNRFSTQFMAVRFGNVIGSNGSVIPIFKEQIKKGGPVTVTHPQMERFFMTIPEASQLVLQAGSIGNGGEIFILDMGEPVKILDIAKETIRLSGFEPDEDIQIVFTGMRPGEKLYEELETDTEKLIRTIHSKIFIGEIMPYSNHRIQQAILLMTNLAKTENHLLIRHFLKEFLPESHLEIAIELLPFEVESTNIVNSYNLLTV